MTVKQQIIQGLDSLNTEGQAEVLALIKSLSPQNEQQEYDALLAELLEQRLAYAKKNPDDNTTLEAMRAELPKEKMQQIVLHLNSKLQQANRTTDAKQATIRKAGAFKGSLGYMADDFDAPLDDFKDYM